MKLFLTVLLCFLVTITSPTIIANGCIEVERDALLTFKAGLHDPGNLLSSWHGPYCCNWTGVICDNITEHVVQLDLRNPYDCDDYSCIDRESHALIGEINPALLSLKYLTHLDISNNDFSNISFPKFICSFEKLVYLNLSLSRFQGVIPHELGNISRLQFLDLSYSNFTGLIPPQLGNLSNLQYLSLSFSYYYSSKPAGDHLSWISRLSNLTYLDLSSIDLNNIFDWPAISEMHLLETLMLSGCSLSEIPVDLSHVNLTSLTKLDLSYNSFNTTLPNWLWNLTSLLYLNLQLSRFHGSIPGTLSNLASLNYLNLGENNFEHLFLEPINKLPNLITLQLSELGISGDIANLIKGMHNLENLYLDGNNLSGNIASWIAEIKNLSFVDLSDNSLHHIDSEIGTLVHLKELDLSNNLLSSVITDAHFANLSNLEILDLSHNMLTIKLNEKWVPPFQLRFISLNSCKVGPKFPSWLRWQTRVTFVSLFNTSITDVIPTWFWNLSLGRVDLSYNNIMGSLPVSFQLSKIRGLNLRSNNISGPLPSAWGGIRELDLSNNNISGPFPPKLEFPRASFVALSKNRIHGSISHSICYIQFLFFLDLSNNAISGEIPICLGNISGLQYVYLSNNQITGELPATIGSLQLLEKLQLYNNKLHGEIPSTLQQCKRLVFLSLGSNNFSGKIPTWIGKQLRDLAIFQLRLNKFTGSIPPEIGELGRLQILDLAHNSLVGSIPNSVGNFSSMKDSSTFYSSSVGFDADLSEDALFRDINGDYLDMYEDILYIDINGQYVYTSLPLEYVKMIDISGNNLKGHIPEEIWSLQTMLDLNLSKNYLIGEIPETIGGMRSLESLDLSFNEFSGPIPQAISTLSSLHNLNLSYNNFSGKIPIGRQLDTLNNSSIYVGNSYLCGPPTDKSCSDGQPSIGIDSGHGENGREKVWFYLSVALGFILGFWSVWGVLIFRNVWRVVYFRTIDNLFDKMYVQIVLATRRLIGGNA